MKQIALACLLAPVLLRASALTDASQYSIFTLDSATVTNASVGKGIASGGSIHLNSVSVAHASGNYPNNYALIAGGSINASNGWAGRAGIAGGSATATNFGLSGGLLQNVTEAGISSVVDFDQFAQDLRDESAFYGSLAPTGSAVFEWGGYTLTGSDPSLNIFHLDLAKLSLQNVWLTINAPWNSTLLLNVYGNSGQLNHLGINGNASRAVLNFVDAGSLVINGGGYQATVLAPNADVQAAGIGLTGSMIARSLVGSGGFQGLSFEGQLPVREVTAATPEPSSLVMGALGLLAMAGSYAQRRRRN